MSTQRIENELFFISPTGDYSQTYSHNSTWGNTELATAGSKHVCLTTQEISLTVNIVAICVGIVIIFGNFLVLFVLFRYPSRTFTPFNWLLCHLAVADTVIGVTVFWWYGLAEVLRIPVTNFQKVGFYGSSIVSVLASLEGLMTIALDRYFLILKQRRYTSTITKKRLAVAIVAMWLLPSILELIIPLSGWSCVDQCDCRIHNVRPDDVYCFGGQCSQILPPITRHQLFLTGIISCALFVITISLYIIIFYGVQKQSNKLKNHLSPLRSLGTPKSPTYRRELPNFQVTNSPAASPRLGRWRKNLATADGQGTPTLTNNLEFRFSALNKAFEMPEEDHTAEMSSNEPKIDNNRLMARQASNATTVTELTTTPTPTKEAVRFQELSTPVLTKGSVRFQSIASESSDVKTQSQSESKPPLIRENVLMRPKSLPTNDVKTEENRISTFIHRLTRRGKRRTTASRRRDLRVMQSMFIILSVFIVTTAPLMIFVIYTFPNNDRELKEIFNYLLQVTTLNSLLNPFLYFWRIPHMRKKLKLLVHARYFERRWKESSFWRWSHPGKHFNPKKPKKEVSEPSWESAPSEGSVKE